MAILLAHRNIISVGILTMQYVHLVLGNLELDYDDGIETEGFDLDQIDPYDYDSTKFLTRFRVKEPFCSFFDNRSPQPQNDLKNCTWYQDNSCCRQPELESIFKKVKPLQGASESCMRQINYMICWVCDPMQYNFYRNGWHRLRMCRSFCNAVLDACKTAKLKGSQVGILYKDGVEFCKGRRFDVSMDDRNCFTYSGTWTGNGWKHPIGSAYLIQRAHWMLLLINLLCVVL